MEVTLDASNHKWDIPRGLCAAILFAGLIDIFAYCVIPQARDEGLSPFVFVSVWFALAVKCFSKGDQEQNGVSPIVDQSTPDRNRGAK